MLESTASATIRDAISSIDRLWIGSAADYPYRVGVPVKVGIRIPPHSFTYNMRHLGILAYSFCSTQSRQRWTS